MIRKLGGLVALGAMALIASAGVSSASANTNERFTMVVRFSGGQMACSVVASGPITGVGECAVEDVLGDEPHVVHVTLNGGSFDLTATTVSESDNFNEPACVFRFTSEETFELTGVAGLYSNVRGSGTDTARGLISHPRTANGGCGDELAGGVIVVRALAKVTL